jgi:hypothetical protein
VNLSIFLPYVALILGGLGGALLVVFLAATLVPDRWLRADPRGTLAEADVFIVFGLGLGRAPDGGETPGASNAAIARWTIQNNVERKPTIVQEGVYLALQEMERSQPDLGVDAWVIRLPHHPNVYVNTYKATLQCWAIMQALGYHRPALVSHDLQLQRMVWNFERIGWADQVIVPSMPSIPFDSNSIQHWGTRSRRNWVVWELFFARPISLLVHQ